MISLLEYIFFRKSPKFFEEKFKPRKRLLQTFEVLKNRGLNMKNNVLIISLQNIILYINLETVHDTLI